MSLAFLISHLIHWFIRLIYLCGVAIKILGLGCYSKGEGLFHVCVREALVLISITIGKEIIMNSNNARL